jgi:hypothetical protein
MRFLRRSAAVTILSVATIAGVMAFAPETAGAAGPWFVAPPSASPAGANTATCGLVPTTPCATVTFVLAKPAFQNGDIINVAAGTYTDRPNVGAKGAVIKGAGAATTIFDGGAVSFAMATNTNGVSTSISDVTLRNGAGFTGLGLALAGGGLLVFGGNVTTNNVVITNNTGNQGAGAFVNAGASLVMNGGSVTTNTATAAATFGGAGGGVYVAGKAGATAAGSLTANGVTFTGNRALGGGQVGAGNGGAIFNAGTTAVNGGAFNLNQAVQSTSGANPRRGEGGALYNGGQDADDAPKLTVTGATITGGTVSGGFHATAGGAIANSESFGGAAGDLTVSNTNIDGTFSFYGGAIWNGGNAFVTGGEIKNSVAVLGGGIAQFPYVVPAAVPSLTVSGTKLTNNLANGGSTVAWGNGGGIFVTRGTATVNGGAIFSGNKAATTLSGSGAWGGWGGAIYVGPYAANDAPQLNLNGVTVTGGAATLLGGGIANAGNILGASAPGASAGKVTATNVHLQTNTAANGGAVYSGGDATFTTSDLTGNAASNAGGAIYADRNPASGATPTIKLDHDVLSGNSGVFGGAVAALQPAAIEVSNGTSMTNNTGVDGGAVFSTGSVKVTASDLSGNHASFQGGGIYSGPLAAGDTPALTLTNATINGNDAANAAGGIAAAGTLTATGGSIDGNTGLGGGGLYLGEGQTASLDGTSISGNTATAYVGGGVLSSGDLTIANAQMTGNRALHTTGNTGLGGAIYSGSNNDGTTVKLSIDASNISGNEAYAAPALITFSPGSGATNTSSISRSTVNGNTSATQFGAIETLHPLTIANSTITANTAVGGPGALYMTAPSGVVVGGTILSGNGATSCTGAFTDVGYNLTDPGDTSCGAGSNRVVAAPQLGALAANGGPTQSRLPGPTSPALDRIPGGHALCTNFTTDQRGVARPAGAKCDIGSVEAAQVTPTVDGPTPVDFTVGGAGSFTYTSTGSPQPSLSLTGTLPSGLTFTDNHDGTGKIAGTPGAGTGGSYTVTVKATNEAGTGTKDVNVVVHQAPVLTGDTSATYTVGVAGGPNEFHMASGHPAATLSTSSPLPSGVTFTPGANGTATIQGTPAVGTGGVYVIVIDGTNGTLPDAHWTFTLTVNEGPTINGPATDTATVGSAHTSAEYTTTGTPTATLSATGLPAGLSLTSSGPGKAKITGTPANGTGGVYDVVVTATNHVGSDATMHTALTVKEAPEITGPSVVRFVATFPGTASYGADGYPGPAAIASTGTLPSGVTFHDNGNGTATLAGTAPLSAVGSYDLTITATNGVGAGAQLHVTLEIAPPLSITTTTLPHAAVGTSYAGSVAAAGGQPAYVFTLESGTLPAGLSLSPSGAITGVPTGPTGTSSFVVRATDSADPAATVTKPLSITVDKGATTLAVDPILLDTHSGVLGTITVGVVRATLTGGNPAIPIAGQTIVWTVNGTPVCSGTTDANGRATCTMSLVNTTIAILSGKVTGTYAGNALWLGSSGSSGLVGAT